jgi:hypothetical protein
MNRWWCVIALWLMVPLALAQGPQQSQPASRQAKALIQSLYQQVVVRHPIGIPEGENMTTFAPYLSMTLLRRINLASACGADWHRQNPGSQLKPAFDWLELDLFSGADEEATPSSFAVERTQFQKDGSIRLYVTLTYREPGERPWTWRVAPIVLRKNGQYVVDDVIFIGEHAEGAEARLSAFLSEGCDGPRWVGLKGGSKDQKSQR